MGPPTALSHQIPRSGTLVAESGNEQIADAWGDLQDEGVYLPRSDGGRIKTWQAILWSLAHQIRGMGEPFDAALERSGLIVTG
jgi:hypothetical protein